LGWLLQLRPTSFFWETNPTCSAAECAQAITSIGNPALWLIAVVGLIVVLYFAIVWADRRAWAVFAGYLGGYVPWLFFMQRTIFTFYTIAFTPFVVLAVCFLIWVILHPQPRLRHPTPARVTLWRKSAAVGIVVTILAFGLFWLPIWTAWSVPKWFWSMHIWLPSWV
jgi:dolichyl-phosphate-mannose--protein O-mannosyl transferase